VMQGVAQGDFGHLQGRIEALAEGHIPKVTGEGGNRGSAVLPVGIQAFRGENPLNLPTGRSFAVL
jgi:hypothetical protein